MVDIDAKCCRSFSMMVLQKQKPKFPRVPSRPPSRLCSSRERTKWLGLVGMRAVVARLPGAQHGERPTASNEEPPGDFEAKIDETSLKHESFGIWQFEGKLHSIHWLMIMLPSHIGILGYIHHFQTQPCVKTETSDEDQQKDVSRLFNFYGLFLSGKTSIVTSSYSSNSSHRGLSHDCLY